jgi:hypothetical protein
MSRIVTTAVPEDSASASPPASRSSADGRAVSASRVRSTAGAGAAGDAVAERAGAAAFGTGGLVRAGAAAGAGGGRVASACRIASIVRGTSELDG